MTDILLLAPVGLPLLTAIVAVFLRHAPHWQRRLNLAGSLALTVAAAALFAAVMDDAVLSSQMGGWPAPFGITLVADGLSAIMVLVAAVMGLLIAIYALADIDDTLLRRGFVVYYQILVGGVCGAFLTGDLFNLYVWFETTLIASFGLLVLGGTREQLDAGVKYVVVNVAATLLLLISIGMLYGLTGTLNLADLSRTVADIDNDGLLNLISVLFIVAFGIKAALFPFFFWLPASYHTPATAVTAIFGALLTKLGVYALIRLFTLVLTHDPAFTNTVLLVLALLTMVTGVLGAAAQNDVNRILSFHIISQIGYMILGLALYAPLAVAGAIIYTVHNILAKTNLFLIAGILRRHAGSLELHRLGGFYQARPALAVAFLISALSLAGLPPLSGFWAKLIVVQAGMDAQAYAAAGIALAVGFLTLFSMTKIWIGAFWTPAPPDAEPVTPPSRAGAWALQAPVWVLVACIVLAGFTAETLFGLSLEAGRALMDPSTYIATVLPPGA